MPWLPNGDYYQFTESSISTRAPAASGIYGIYNFRHQLLIGASNNVRATLLQFATENKFRLKRFKPTGFTFEKCTPELRESRARLLINEYQPILNNASAVPMISLFRSLNYQGASAFHPPLPRKAAQKLLPAPQEPAPTIVPVRVRPVRSSRYRWAGSFALAALIAAVYLGWRAWPFGRIGSQPPKRVAATAHSTPSQANSSIVPPQQQSAVSVIPEAEASAKVRTEQSKIADKVETASSSTGLTTAPEAAKAPIPQPTNEATASNEVKNPRPRAAPNSERQNKWTVQVRATLDRADATGVIKRLKALGYDAFVAEAEIKGKIWYRVRVGNFATQPQAETLQKQLRGEEGFRDAFIVNKANESLVLAKRSGESVPYEP